jgi:hypothetical protein
MDVSRLRTWFYAWGVAAVCVVVGCSQPNSVGFRTLSGRVDVSAYPLDNARLVARGADGRTFATPLGRAGEFRLRLPSDIAYGLVIANSASDGSLRAISSLRWHTAAGRASTITPSSGPEIDLGLVRPASKVASLHSSSNHGGDDGGGGGGGGAGGGGGGAGGGGGGAGGGGGGHTGGDDGAPTGVCNSYYNLCSDGGVANQGDEDDHDGGEVEHDRGDVNTPESGDDDGAPKACAHNGAAELPSDVRPALGATFTLADAFLARGPLPAAILDVTMSGGSWRLMELSAGTPFVVSQDDCTHAGNRDIGRDRINVTWRNGDGSVTSDHLDLRYCKKGGSSGARSSSRAIGDGCELGRGAGGLCAEATESESECEHGERTELHAGDQPHKDDSPTCAPAPAAPAPSDDGRPPLAGCNTAHDCAAGLSCVASRCEASP